MRIRLLLLSFVIFSCNNSNKNTDAIDDIEIAKEKLLKEIDSIKKVDSINSIPKEAWFIDGFVDDFGDPTNNKYIYTTTSGSFSNSATNNSDLYVQILITEESIGVFLTEYYMDRSPIKFIGGGDMMLKNDHNYKLTVHSSNDWNTSGGIKIDKQYYKKFIDFIKSSNGSVKAVVKDKYSSVYNFNIDTEGFILRYKELK